MNGKVLIKVTTVLNNKIFVRTLESGVKLGPNTLPSQLFVTCFLLLSVALHLFKNIYCFIT